jgi:rare lipoprotein A (peptidoglycan hydrolase)
MQTRHPGFWVYCLAVASFGSLIVSGVSADANVSRKVREFAASVVAPAQDPNAPGVAPLSEAQPGEPETSPPLRAAQVGIASWYGPWFRGRLTANGEIFDDTKLTAAHRTLPLASKVKVTNLENGKSIEVTVNDRGPYIAGRVLDLSTRAAQVLGMEKEGLALVRIEVLQPPQQLASAAAE